MRRVLLGRWQRRATVFVTAMVLALVGLAASSTASAGFRTEVSAVEEATPLRETEPVPHSGDAADDVAIWVHPTEPASSAIIGTDKLGGLAVYDMDGKQLHFYDDSAPNNVDLRTGFPLGGRTETLVVTSDRATKSLRTYTIDPVTRALTSVDARELSVGIGLAGLCMYHSTETDSFFVFISDSSGTTQQWELVDDGTGKVDARKVRKISVGSTSEGCVVDDEAGTLFVAEEDVALWSYSADPNGGTARTAVDRVGSGRLTADIEGLALYEPEMGEGYLIASSQGSNSFAVYEREAPYAAVGSFTVGAGAGSVDAVTYTDGIDITSRPLGSGFDSGAFIAQDDSNDGGNQNFKLVPWSEVAEAFSPPLLGGAADVDGGSAEPPPPTDSAPDAEPSPVSPESITHLVEADAYVSSAHPRKNYGGATALWVDGSPAMRTYLRFPEPATDTARALLKVFVTRSSEPFEVGAVADTGWEETSINQSTAPDVGKLRLESGPATEGSWVSIDVTELLPRSGAVSLALVASSSTSQAFSSREAGKSTAPRLVYEASVASPDPTSPGGPTYYLDADSGDDSNSGNSPTDPWRSLAKVNGMDLPPGAKVLLRRGIEWSESLKPESSGTPLAPITFGAYGEGKAPVIRDQSTCLSVSGDYLVVRDLEIRACSWAGIAVSGTHVRVESNYVTDTAAGIYLKRGATENSIVHNRLIDNNRMSVLTKEPGGDAGAFGVLVRGDNNEISHNTIAGSDAFSYDYGRDGAAVEIYGGIGNRIHHNIAVDNDSFTELGNSRTADNSFTYNLVRSSLESSNFLVTRGGESKYGPVLGTSAHHNTVVLTGDASQGFVCYAGCSPSILSLRNNIVQAVAKVGYSDDTFDEGNNVFNIGKQQFPVSSTSVVGDPRFVDAPGGDFHLRPDSPAIDLGTPLGYEKDLDGMAVPADGDGDGTARPDAGAMEYDF